VKQITDVPSLFNKFYRLSSLNPIICIFLPLWSQTTVHILVATLARRGSTWRATEFIKHVILSYYL